MSNKSATPIVLTAASPADILSRPGIRASLFGYIEAYTKVEPLKTRKDDPTEVTKPDGSKDYVRDAKGRIVREDIRDASGEKVSASTVLPRGVRRHVKLVIQSYSQKSDHAAAVNAARERAGLEPDYPERPHQWATRYNGSPLVYVHADPAKRQGVFYLQVRLCQGSVVKTESRYEDMDGNILEFNDIKSALSHSDWPEARREAIAKEAAAQELSVKDAVLCRDFTLNNVIRFAYDGREYEIAANVAATADSRPADTQHIGAEAQVATPAAAPATEAAPARD